MAIPQAGKSDYFYSTINRTMVSSEKIKVIIVEDEPEIREWLRLVLSGSERTECLASFADAETCLYYFHQYTPDVVIMDIHLPGMNGIDCIRKLKPEHAAVQFMMFTVFEEDSYVFESLCSGATGYILKNTTSEKLIEAVVDLNQGGSPMSTIIARKVINSFQRPARSSNELHKLSQREQEILNLLAGGYRYKEIAAILFISVETVRTHIRNIYEKLQVQSRTEALNKVFPK